MTQSIAFDNPPVSEVVVATYFNPPLLDLRSEHVGLFWSQIQKDFPTVRQQPPVGIAPSVFTDEIVPMPRYWFIAEDEINLIQIQKNAFMFNWRRRKDKYPRFHEDIKPAFDKYYGRFTEFVRAETDTENLTIDLCELTYINTVERCDYWAGRQDTTKVIPSFSTPEPGIGASEAPHFDCNYAYEISDDLQLRVNMRSGFKAQQQDEPVLTFEIRTSGRLGQAEKSEADKWFERAHDVIIECFLGMTDPDIQNRYWKLVKETP